MGRRRVTLGAAEPGVEAGQYNSGGGLLLRPSHGPLQHSMSERPSSRGGGAPGEGRTVLDEGCSMVGLLPDIDHTRWWLGAAAWHIMCHDGVRLPLQHAIPPRLNIPRQEVILVMQQHLVAYQGNFSPPACLCHRHRLFVIQPCAELLRMVMAEADACVPPPLRLLCTHWRVVPAARLSLAGSGIPRPSTPRLMDDFNTDGSTLLLRPSAPVYCCDLDPAALGGVGSPAAHTAAGSVQGSDAATPSLPSFGAPDWSVAAAAGVAGIGSRCGYRADGFGSHHHSSNAGGDSSTKAQFDTARPTGVDPGVAVSGLAVPPDVHSKGAASTTEVVGAAANTTATRPGAAKPGQFWPSSSLGAAGGAGGRRGMLTGFNTQLAVGPGGLVIGPSAAGSGMGLRPRPKSSHTAAVESIAKRQAMLQVRGGFVQCWLHQMDMLQLWCVCTMQRTMSY